MPRKKKRKSLSKVKKEAWDVFANLVKLSNADDRGYCQCYTCSAKKMWNDTNMHAGHFRSRSHSNTLYDPMNVKPQCAACNSFGGGEQYLFGKHLDEEYGEGTSDGLVMKSNQTKQWTITELECLMEDWKEDLRTLGYLID